MGRYRSIQSTLIENALKGITDNQTVTAYKKGMPFLSGTASYLRCTVRYRA